jgi:thiamine-phosphate pyrophosphorylase
MQDDLRLVAIAGPPVLEVSNLVSACVAAAEGGVTAVQLRLKAEPAAVTLDLARDLVSRLSVPVWVNDRVDIAVAADARGVHVGSEDIPPDLIRAFAPPNLQIGVSVGDATEAERALGAAVHYWSIGAMFATRTKADAGPPIGPSGFRAVAAMAPPTMPTIAIGGITEENVAAVLDAGAHGVAVSQAVFGARSVRQAAQRLRTVIDRYRSE